MQQYLTLEEAAKNLNISPDELREMAKKKTIRAFQDRGTWRFRAQDIEEGARKRGLGSAAELSLGESKVAPPPKKPAADEPLPVEFSLDSDDDSDEVPLGKEKRGTSGPRSG